MNDNERFNQTDVLSCWQVRLSSLASRAAGALALTRAVAGTYYSHAGGHLVATYTVDDRERLRDLADAGVDAITSNDIAALVPLLREHAGRKAAEHGH
jgi:glycerophosphoryl diester phosphodiesterase